MSISKLTTAAYIRLTVNSNITSCSRVLTIIYGLHIMYMIMQIYTTSGGKAETVFLPESKYLIQIVLKNA